MNEPQQAINDLNWMMRSPSLIDDGFPTLSEIALPEADIDALTSEVIDPGSPFVGRYFERLVGFWLKNICDYEILFAHQQIINDGRTLGEVDFLFRDQTGNIVHLETAVKFYLHFPEKHVSGSHLLGPNPHDDFESKVHRLLQHQLNLGTQLVPNIDRKEVLMKGRIYYHVSHSAGRVAAPLLSPSHLQGRWLYPHESSWFHQQPSEKRYVVLPKPYWLGELSAATDSSSILQVDEFFTFVKQHFARSHRPLHIAMLAPDQNGWTEFDRLFIVHNFWPHES